MALVFVSRTEAISNGEDNDTIKHISLGGSEIIESATSVWFMPKGSEENIHTSDPKPNADLLYAAIPGKNSAPIPDPGCPRCPPKMVAMSTGLKTRGGAPPAGNTVTRVG